MHSRHTDRRRKILEQKKAELVDSEMSPVLMMMMLMLIVHPLYMGHREKWPTRVATGWYRLEQMPTILCLK
uniref:Uncharacterized protein n=1 Tax=Onchocerca volvulus TaxID=6282 RepID=A0A8R1XTS9_ONCVO